MSLNNTVSALQYIIPQDSSKDIHTVINQQAHNNNLTCVCVSHSQYNQHPQNKAISNYWPYQAQCDDRRLMSKEISWTLLEPL